MAHIIHHNPAPYGRLDHISSRLFLLREVRSAKTVLSWLRGASGTIQEHFEPSGVGNRESGSCQTQQLIVQQNNQYSLGPWMFISSFKFVIQCTILKKHTYESMYTLFSPSARHCPVSLDMVMRCWVTPGGAWHHLALYSKLEWTVLWSPISDWYDDQGIG